MAQAGKQATTTEDAERLPTPRVILKRERVLVLPEDVSSVDSKAIREALGTKGTVSEAEAWVVVDEQTGTQAAAIEAYTGPAGDPETKPGEFKAPPLRGWKGGLRMVRPPKPKVERQVLDD